MKKDTNQLAKSIVDQATKDPAAVALGRRGGLKGGKARAAKLTPERRKEIALMGVQARKAKKYKI